LLQSRISIIEWFLFDFSVRFLWIFTQEMIRCNLLIMRENQPFSVSDSRSGTSKHFRMSTLTDDKQLKLNSIHDNMFFPIKIMSITRGRIYDWNIVPLCSVYGVCHSIIFIDLICNFPKSFLVLIESVLWKLIIMHQILGQFPVPRQMFCYLHPLKNCVLFEILFFDNRDMS
jgi:hypothetical protein